MNRLRKSKSLFAEARTLVQARRHARTPFELQIAWSTNYDDLFQLRHDVQSETVVLQTLRSTGRGVLVGRAGSGKTCLMARVAERALGQDVLPIFVELKNWKSSHYEEWREWLDKGGSGSAFLVARFSQPRTSFMELDLLPPTTEKLLLVDGLNEITESVGQQFLEALEAFASAQIQASVLVSDRLIRRDIPDTWQVGRVLPLSTARISKYAGRKALTQPRAALLELPFYLDASLRDPGDAGLANAQTQQEFITRQIGLSGADLDRAALGAFSIYKRAMSRTFTLADFAEIVGAEVVAKLQAVQVLEVVGQAARFTHHLTHDSLAARHLARAAAAEWSSENLNAITFRASSLDPVVLIFEQLDPEQADTFLRRVYDWNLYAAGYALTEHNPANVGPSPEMEVIIFAMLGEKKLDQVLATARRAGDAISISRSPYAEPFRHISDIEELFAATHVAQLQKNSFLEWRNVFTRPVGGPVTDKDVASVSNDEAVTGWTWANVLKRCSLTLEQQTSLRAMFGPNITSTVQWRIVHVLGAFPSGENKDLLFRALEPEFHTDVRYGAIRSVVEMMSRAQEDLREIIVGDLRDRRPVLEQNEIVLRELKRALLIRPDMKPPRWEETVLKVVREFYRHADRQETRDAWRRFALELEALYEVA
jgi:hypothetical protein